MKHLKNLISFAIFISLLSVKGFLFASDTGFKDPTANAAGSPAGFFNPTDAYSSNDIYAEEITEGNNHIFSTFVFSIPAGATINGVEVALEILADGEFIQNGDRARVDVYISEDGGSGWSAAKTAYYDLWTETIEYLGGSADPWGLTLEDTSFSDANFRVKVLPHTFYGAVNIVYVDWVGVKVYYTPLPGGARRVIVVQ